MSEVNAIPLRKVVNFSVKAKLLKIKCEGIGACFPLLVILFFLSTTFSAIAQVENPVKAPTGTLPVLPDSSSRLTRLDTIPLTHADSLKVKADSTKKVKKGDIETTIFYSAKDSINSSIDRKIVKLYGEAKIKYGEIELEAEKIVIDYEQSTITANAGTDSLGNRIGYPIFKNGSELYETRDMIYNFKTKKAKISEVVTKQNDGFLHGEAVFKNEKNELFSVGNGYTTCNLAHPHFRIVSTKIKAIPGDKMISGPFYIEILDVPTPVGFIFGIFPSQRKSASGILVPTYGEENKRGFFLRNGGYFFDINDYIKLSLLADIYSKGSSAIYVNSTYKKLYAYNGSFRFSYTNNVYATNIESPTKQKDFQITWSHTPQSKGTGRFSASVTAATGGYTANNYLGATANTTTTSTLNNGTAKLSSNISYSKTFPNTPFSLGINFRHNQDLERKTLQVALPDLSFNVNNLYPFKRVKNNLFLQNMSTRLTMAATNQISNDLGNIGLNGVDSISPVNSKTYSYLLSHAKKGIKMNIPLSTSVKFMKFFTITPSLSIDELFYFEKLHWGVAPSGNTFVRTDTVKKFNNITNYSGSVSMTTRIYGFKAFKSGKIQAIHHVMNPSIGLTFAPDFGASKYGYYQTFDAVTNDVHSKVYQSLYDGFVYGGSRRGKSSALSFGLGNVIEMKVKGKNDTIAKKIPIFNTLSLSSSYNFAAADHRLAPFSLAANTNVLDNKVNVSLSGTIDPYKYVLDSTVNSEKQTTRIFQHRSERLAWKDGFSIGQLTAFSFAFSTNLNPKGQKKDTQNRDKVAASNIPDKDKAFLMNNPAVYVDFSIPWNLRLNYNLAYSRTGFLKASVTQGLRFTGDVSLSEKWKIVFGSGYDFKSKQFTMTNISLNRELHCWQMNVSWVPFGRFTSYSFTISVRSAMLRDLKLPRNRSFIDTF